MLWCLRERDLITPALARAGLDPNRVIYCETWKDRGVLPTMEEGLHCHMLGAVVGAQIRLSLTAARPLQLAAGASGVTGIVIRRWRNTSERAEAFTQARRDGGYRRIYHPI